MSGHPVLAYDVARSSGCTCGYGCKSCGEDVSRMANCASWSGCPLRRRPDADCPLNAVPDQDPGFLRLRALERELERPTRRTLNVADGVAGLPPLIVCPRCDGQAFDRGSCGLCGNFGYLLDHDATRLAHVDAMQIAATFALALGLQLGLPKAEAVSLEDAPATKGSVV